VDWNLESNLLSSIDDVWGDERITADASKHAPKLSTRAEHPELTEKAHTTLKEVVLGHWDEKMSADFLICFGVQTATVKNLCKFLVSACPNEGRPHCTDSEFLEIAKTFKEIITPHVWLKTDMTMDCVSVMMHLVFLSVTEAATKSLEEVLAKFKKKTDFRCTDDDPNQLLSEFHHEQLDWAKGLKFGGKNFNGGWVSKQFLIFARTCKTEFSYLLTLTPKDDSQQELLDLSLKLFLP
jgi:hypothetical protein